jgi:hypothetical protein
MNMSEETNISNDPLVEAKLELVDIMVELGSASHAVSEAVRLWDEKGGELQCEEECLNAETALEKIEKQAFDMRSKIEDWRNGIPCPACAGTFGGHCGKERGRGEFGE